MNSGLAYKGDHFFYKNQIEYILGTKCFQLLLKKETHPNLGS